MNNFIEISSLTEEERNLLNNIKKNGSINASNWTANKELLDYLESKGFLKSETSLWTRKYFINESIS